MRRLVALLAAVSALTLVLSPAASSQTTDRRYVSILFGRTQWVHAKDCVRAPNTVDLGTASQALRSRNLTATGNIVLNQTPNSGFWCEGGFSLHPGWDRIQTLRQRGWTFVSAGRAYINMATATYQQASNNSCGSLPVFAQRGIDASGMYAYPNDKYTTAVQADPVSTCFRWGRTYGTGVNTRSQMSWPWFQSTHTTQGARCNAPNAGCPYAAQEKWQYTLPGRIISTIRNLQPGQWYAVQFYRFVTGAQLDTSDRFQWDCRATDPKLHWATRPEIYCWNDFVRVIDALAAEQAAGRVVVTDPKAVAAAWGRGGGSGGGGGATPDTTPPDGTVSTPSDGQLLSGIPARLNGRATDDVGVTKVRIAIRDRSSGLWLRNGRWGAFMQHDATLGNSGGTSTRWRYAFRPPPGGSGRYALQVAAVDAAGNVDPTKPWVRFRLHG